VQPEHIPDFLALVGDAADGYPGIAGYGRKTAARMINRYGKLEDFPPEGLRDDNRTHALLFKTLAILRTDAFNAVSNLITQYLMSRSPIASVFKRFLVHLGRGRTLKRSPNCITDSKNFGQDCLRKGIEGSGGNYLKIWLRV
jgi:5'-3' exonuclease